jgi:Berberine and berberine like
VAGVSGRGDAAAGPDRADAEQAGRDPGQRRVDRRVLTLGDWKAEFLPGLSSEFLDAFRSSAVRVTSPLSQSIIFHVAGALNDHEDDDGAVGNRDAHYIGGFAATWPPGALSDPHVAWARDGWERIRPFSTGGNYVNFQLAEDDTDRTADAYGSNYRRLQRVKADYGPDNLFRVNRNIPPAPAP